MHYKILLMMCIKFATFWHYLFIFSLFLKVVWVLGSAALELVFKLLDIKTNETVIKACNVVKVMIFHKRSSIFLFVFHLANRVLIELQNSKSQTV